MEARIEDIDVIQPEEDQEGRIIFHLCDGRSVSMPLSWSWRLEEAEPEERTNYDIDPSGYGVHWPDVDEDLSAKGVLRGGRSQRPSDGDATPAPTEERVRRESWPPARIKRLRLRIGDTQQEFAERLGVRQGTVSNWETGTHVPRRLVCRLLDQLASEYPLQERSELTPPSTTTRVAGSKESQTTIDDLRKESEGEDFASPK